MLQGYISVEGRKYMVEGVDGQQSLNLTLSTALIENMQYLDPDNPDVGYTSKKFKFGSATVNVESEKDWETDKYFKPNRHVVKLLGTFFKYIKTNCINTNSVLTLDTGEFEARVEDNYEIEIAGSIASVTTEYGLLKALSYEGNGVEIELGDEPVQQAYQTSKNNVSVKHSEADLEELWGIKPRANNVLLFDNVNSDKAFYDNLDQIIENNPNRDFTWLRGRDYRIVTDDTLEETLEYLNTFDVLSVDTETTGLRITFKSRTREHDQCVGFVITGKEGESFYFPMRHTKIDNLCNGDDFYLMENYLKPLLESKDIIVHNAPFDWAVGWIYQVSMNIVFDTMAFIALTLTAKYGTRMGLKYVTSQLLKRDSLELDDLCVGGDFNQVDETFADLPYELVRLYACADADNTLAIYNYIRKTNMIEEYGAAKLIQFETIFGCAIGYQKFHGQFTHVHRTDELVEQITQETEKYLNLIHQELEKLNYDVSKYKPASAPQNKKIMYEILGCPEQKNAEGKVHTGKDARKAINREKNADGSYKYPFVYYLHMWNESDTLRKNFTSNLPKFCTPDGFMFSDVKQFLNTGRVSTKEPNYQGYNDTVKKYIQPRKGYYMADMDYASIEYRVIASMSGQERLVEAFQDPYMDYHKLQASNMYDVPYVMVTPEMRSDAKPFNFGIPFGMGDAKLGLNLFGKLTDANTRKAKIYRKRYFKNQEKVEKFFEDARNNSVELGYTETHFGRRRYYNKETTSVHAIRRQGGNQRIQGTAADIYKQAVARLFLRLHREGWLDLVLFSGYVHDELVQEVSNEIHPLEWMKVLKEEMELVIEGFCPIYIGFGVGNSWYDAKETEIPTELQNQLQGRVEEYPEWDGDADKLNKWTKDRINQFEMEYVKEYIQNPDNQGEIISDVANDFMTSQIKRLVKEGFHYPKNKVDATDLHTNLDFICEYLGVNRQSVNLKSILDVEVKTEAVEELPGGSENFSLQDLYQQTTDEDRAKELFQTKIREYGFSLQVEEKTVYFRYDKGVMDIAQKYINKDGEGYQVAFYDESKDTKYVTKSNIQSKSLQVAQKEIIMSGVVAYV